MMNTIAGVLLLCFFSFNAFSQSSNAENTIKDTFILIDNEAMTLGELSRDKPLLLAFFSTSCAECKKQIPSLRDVHHAFGKKVVFYAINTDAGISADALTSYRRDRDYPLPVTVDFGNYLQRSFSIPGTPTYVYINETGDAVTKTHTINAKLMSRLNRTTTE